MMSRKTSLRVVLKGHELPETMLKLTIPHSADDAVLAFQSKHSISSFPTATLTLRVSSPTDPIRRLHVGDDVKVYAQAETQREDFLFAGEVRTIESVGTREGGETLEIAAVSPFARLIATRINMSDVEGCETLKSLCLRLLDLCTIPAKIAIEPAADVPLALDGLTQFCPMSLLRVIAFQHGLTLFISRGDELRIASVETMMNREPVANIGSNDILSWRIKRT